MNDKNTPGAGAVPCNLELSKDELITTLQTALRLCRQAVEDGSLTPSARLELVRDYATPALVAAERAAMTEWRAFWKAQAPDMEPAAIETAAQAMAVGEKAGIIPAKALARLRAKVAGMALLNRADQALKIARACGALPQDPTPVNTCPRCGLSFTTPGKEAAK